MRKKGDWVFKNEYDTGNIPELLNALSTGRKIADDIFK